MRGAAASLLLLAPLLAGAQGFVPPVGEDGRLSPRWRVVGLPEQKPPLTRYGVERVEGQDVLRIDAEGSYGNLVLPLPGQRAPARVAWRWRLPQPNPAADVRTKPGDDTAARVCLAFELPLERVPFVERQLLRLARSRSGEPLPSATLCWVWGASEPLGQPIANPYSRRVRYIVLRSVAESGGPWQAEQRDVAADWRTTFGDESPEPPPLAAVVVAADADNTGGRSTAWLTGLTFGP